MTGGALSDAMRMQRPFTLRRAMEVAIDTARGLAYMHNRKPGAIIHRDLKPGNLMISGSQYHSRWGSTVQLEVYLKGGQLRHLRLYKLAQHLLLPVPQQVGQLSAGRGVL